MPREFAHPVTLTFRAAVARLYAGSVIDRWRIWGVAGVVVSMICAASAFAALSPALSTPDETAHMDYAYQVWTGHLPVFENGLVFRPPAKVPPVQWEAQHPPLFYALLAPVVGPLVNGGHWLAAVLAGRAVCVLIAVACVIALAWAGSLVSTRRPAAWAIAVPAVVAPFSPFMRVGGSVYNDNLATLFAILALGIGILALRRGVSRGVLAAAAAVAAGGMFSRAMFVITLLVLIGTLLAAEWTHGDRRWPSLARRFTLITVSPLVACAITSGWFYLRNKHLTGTYTGGHSDWAEGHLDRSSQPITHVLTENQFWGTNMQLLRQQGNGINSWLGPLLLEVLAAAAVIVQIARFARRRRAIDRTQLAIGLMLGAQVAGTLLMEAGYVAGGGGIITRYLLPALLPFGVLLAAAVLSAPRVVAALGLFTYLAVAWGFFVSWAWIQPTGDDSHWSGHTVNHVPWSLVTVALAGIVGGAAAQTWALARVQVTPPRVGHRPAHARTVASRDRAIQRPRAARNLVPVEPAGSRPAGGPELGPG